MTLLDDEYVGSVRWPRLRQDVAIVTWPSFLVACVATMATSCPRRGHRNLPVYSSGACPTTYLAAASFVT